MGKRSFESVVEDVLLELMGINDVFSVNDIVSRIGISYRTAQKVLNMIYRITNSGVLQKAKHGGKGLWIWKPRRSYIETKAMIILQDLFEKEKLSPSEITAQYGWDKKIVEKAMEYLLRRGLAKREGGNLVVAEPWKYLRDYSEVRRRILKTLKEERFITILKPVNIDIEYVVIVNGGTIGIKYVPIATQRNIGYIRRKAEQAGINRIIIVTDETEVHSENIVLTYEIDKLKEKIRTPMLAYA